MPNEISPTKAKAMNYVSVRYPYLMAASGTTMVRDLENTFMAGTRDATKHYRIKHTGTRKSQDKLRKRATEFTKALEVKLGYILGEAGQTMFIEAFEAGFEFRANYIREKAAVRLSDKSAQVAKP